MIERITRKLRKGCREPLWQFIAIGSAIFLLYREVAPKDHCIPISQAHVEGLRQDHLRRTGLPPTPEEESALIERLFQDEVLLREALRIGLDQGDPIVRRRLLQKMGFLMENLNPVPEPTEAELQEHFQRHGQRFAQEGRISLVHVFLASNRSGAAPAETEAQSVLDKLSAGTDPGDLGDPFIHGSRFVQRTDKEMAAIFGSSFADSLKDLQEGVWCGPMESSYGFHLVRITSRTEAREPTFAEVRPQVQKSLKAVKRERAKRAAIQRLSDRYEIRLEERDSRKEAVVLKRGANPSG
jgi:peptidyl-prolyl cis-trans isomerase C